MAWMKPSQELEDIIEHAVKEYDCTMKKMFGSKMYFVNNNMWTGVHQESLIVRMSEEDRGEILRTYPEVSMFEPMAGRIMTEYVQLPDSFIRDEGKRVEWIEKSYGFVASLPPKKPKKKHKKQIK
jgi:TfoX/Sxy family transcriptional regulator of competence genes